MIVARGRQQRASIALLIWFTVLISWFGLFKYDRYRFTYESHPIPPEVLAELRRSADDATRAASEVIRPHKNAQ